MNKNIFYNNKERRKWAAETALWLGVLSFALNFILFAPDLFTPESALISKQGEVKTVKTFYIEVTSGRGFKSIKSELIIKLKNDHSLYKIIKNTEKECYNEQYERIKEELKKSHTAFIWIKKSEQSESQPTVFQIADENMKILYSIAEKKSESRLIFISLLIVGFAFFGIYFRFRNPKLIEPKI